MVQCQRPPSPDRTLFPAVALPFLAVLGIALCFQARSQAYLIPNDVMMQETILIVRFDLNLISDKTVEQAIVAAFDRGKFESILGTEEVIPSLDELAAIVVSLPFIDPLDTMVAMGSDTVFLVVLSSRPDEGRPGSAFALTQLTVPANEGPVREFLAGFGGTPDSVLALEQLNENDAFDRWLAVPLTDQPLPPFEWSPAREEAFRRSFAAMEEHAVTAVFRSNFASTDTSMGLVEVAVPQLLSENTSFLRVPIIDIARGIFEADFSGCWLDLGDRPSLGMRVEFRDEGTNREDMMREIPITYDQIRDSVVLPEASKADERVEQERQRLIAERIAACEEQGKQAHTDDLEESNLSLHEVATDLFAVAQVEVSGDGTGLFIEFTTPEVKVVTTNLLRLLEGFLVGLGEGLAEGLVLFPTDPLAYCLDG